MHTHLFDITKYEIIFSLNDGVAGSYMWVTSWLVSAYDFYSRVLFIYLFILIVLHSWVSGLTQQAIAQIDRGSEVPTV